MKNKAFPFLFLLLSACTSLPKTEFVKINSCPVVEQCELVQTPPLKTNNDLVDYLIETRKQLELCKSKVEILTKCTKQDGKQ